MVANRIKTAPHNPRKAKEGTGVAVQQVKALTVMPVFHMDTNPRPGSFTSNPAPC